MAIYGRDAKGHFITRQEAYREFERETAILSRAAQRAIPEVYEALDPTAPLQGRIFPEDIKARDVRKLDKKWHRKLVRKGRGQKWYLFKKGNAVFTTPDSGLGVDAAAAAIIASTQMGKYVKQGIRPSDLKTPDDFDNVFVFYAQGNNDDEDEDYDE